MPGAENFIDRIETIFERLPFNTALQLPHPNGRTGNYTYLDLETRTNQIANLLASQNAAPNTLIGVCLPKSLELYATILAIWKLGAIYIPLSYTLAQDEFEYRLNDSGAERIVTDQHHLEHFKMDELHENYLCLDDDHALIENYADEFLPAINTEALAYIIYTSGTTGTPKGVAVTHRGIVNVIESHLREAEIRPNDKLYQLADPRVDVALMEMWLAFSTGACLCAPTHTVNQLVHALPELTQSLHTTIMIIAPSWLKRIIANKTEHEINTLLSTKFGSIHTLISATEDTPLEVAKAWQYRGRSQNQRTILNGYGPTEATIGAIIATFDGVSFNLGTVNNNFYGLKTYILPPRMETEETANTPNVSEYTNLVLTESGTGELVLIGENLAQGYWKNGAIDEALTATAFVDLETPDGETIRTYRTGDKISWTPDGVRKFAGRISQDRQLKVSGNRIEATPIEKKLLAVPGVLDAYLRVHNQRLVAYLVLETNRAITAEQLRSSITTRTNYNNAEVPSGYYAVTPDTMLTIKNGDPVEHELLKAIVTDADAAEDPINEIELQVQTLWHELLEHGTVGVETPFHEAGGYSLLLTEMLKSLSTQYNIDINYQTLQQPITIRSLSRHITLTLCYEHSIEELTEAGGNEQALVFLPPLAGGATHFYKELAENVLRNNEFFSSWECRLPLLQSSLPETWRLAYQQYTSENPDLTEMANYIAKALIKKIPARNFHIAGWSFGGLLGLPVTHALNETGIETRLYMFDSQSPRILAATDLGDNEKRMKTIIEHIASENGCSEDYIDVDLSHCNSLETQISHFFNSTAENLESKTTLTDNQKKFLSMLKTSKINLLATLLYQPNITIPWAALFTCDTPSIGMELECIEHHWNLSVTHLQEQTAEGTTHFNILQSNKFRQTLRLEIAHHTKLSASRALLYSHFPWLHNPQIREKFQAYCPPHITVGDRPLSNPEMLIEPERPPIQILQGAPGLGILCAARYLENAAWKRFESSPNEGIPILINSINEHQDLDHQLVVALRNHQMSPADVLNIEQANGFIFIIRSRNYELSQTDLDKITLHYPNSRVLFFTDSPFATRELVNSNTILKLSPLPPQLMRQHVVYHLRASEHPIHPKYILQRINQSEVARELGQSPLLLRLLTEQFIEDHLNHHTTKDFSILSQITVPWIECMATRDPENLLDIESLEQFALEAAYLVERIDNTIIPAPKRTPPKKRRARWDRSPTPIETEFAGPPVTGLWDHYTTQTAKLRACTIQTKSGDYRFQFPLIQTFLACQYAGIVLREHKLILQPPMDAHKDTLDITPNFLVEAQARRKNFKIIFSRSAKLLLIWLLKSSKLTILDSPSLGEGESAMLTHLLLAPSLRSQRESEALTIRKAACAITLLNLIEYSITDKDLSGIKIDGAIMPGINLNDCNVSEASLADCDLTGAYLSNTNLTNTDLSRATIGRRANVALPTHGMQLIILPEVNTIIIASGNRLLAIDLTTNTPSIFFTDKTPHHIRCITATNSHRSLAIGSMNGEIKVFKINSGIPRYIFRGHNDGVLDTVYHPSNETILYTTGLDSTVKKWSTETGDERYSITLLFPTQCLLIIPERNQLAVAGKHHEIILLTLNELEPIRTLTIGPGHSIWSLAISPDQQTVAAGSRRGDIILYDTRTQTPHSLSGHFGIIYSMVFSPAGTLISASNDGTLRSWNTATGTHRQFSDGEKIYAILPPTDPNNTVYYTTNTALKAVTHTSWEQPFTHHTAPITGLVYDPNSHHILTIGKDCSALEWDIETGTVTAAFLESTTEPIAIFYLHSESKVIALTSNSDIVTWTHSTQELVNIEHYEGLKLLHPIKNTNKLIAVIDGNLFLLNLDNNDLTPVSNSPDASRSNILITSHPTTDEIFIARGTFIAKIAPHTYPLEEERLSIIFDKPIKAITTHPSKPICIVATTKAIHFIDYNEGSISEIELTTQPKNSISCSEDGNLLAYTTSQGKVALLSREMNEITQTIEPDTSGATYVSFTPNGLVIGTLSGTLYLWGQLFNPQLDRHPESLTMQWRNPNSIFNATNTNITGATFTNEETKAFFKACGAISY